MREQLIQYVDLLFAGGTNCEDVKQEILQNTLDRYDDLISEGKVPEAAYRLAITGIGDINEILNALSPATSLNPRTVVFDSESNDTPAKKWMRAIAIGMYILCPLPVILLESWGWEILGLCGTLVIVAAATVLMILGAKKESEKVHAEEERKTPLQKSISSLIWAFGLGIYIVLSFSTNAWHVTWVIFPILGALDSVSESLVSKFDVKYVDYVPSSDHVLRKNITTIINVAGLTIYFLISFITFAWYITWLIFPITGAVRGLVNAILDYKEAVKHEA